MSLDPTGMRWFSRTYLTEDRGVAFYNSTSVAPDSAFVISRVGFIVLGVLSVWASGRRLERTEHRDLRVGDVARLLAEAAREDAAVGLAQHGAIAARGGNPAAIYTTPRFITSTFHVLRSETRTLLRSPGVWLFGPLILLQTWGTTNFRIGPLDTELLISTGTGATGAFNTLTLLLCFLTLFYTVESLVREERCGLSAIFRAAPVPTAAVLAGKILANAVLAIVIIGAAALAIVIVLITQAVRTGLPAATVGARAHSRNPARAHTHRLVFVRCVSLRALAQPFRRLRRRARSAHRHWLCNAIRSDELAHLVALVERTALERTRSSCVYVGRDRDQSLDRARARSVLHCRDALALAATRA